MRTGTASSAGQPNQASSFVRIPMLVRGEAVVSPEKAVGKRCQPLLPPPWCALRDDSCFHETFWTLTLMPIARSVSRVTWEAAARCGKSFGFMTMTRLPR